MAIEASDDQMRDFGRAVLDSVAVAVPFGSLSKSELELAVFSALVGSGVIDPDDRAFKLAKILRCTPTRARSLVFNHRLRNSDAEDVRDGLVNVVKVVNDAQARAQKRVILNVEQQFWREVLLDELKEHDVFADGSFNRERLTLDQKDFLKACEKVFGADGAKIAKAVKGAGKPGAAEFLHDLTTKAAEGAVKAGASAAAKPTIAYLAGLL